MLRPACVLVLIATAPAGAQMSQGNYALTNVRVVDVLNGQSSPLRTILISKGTIEDILPATVPTPSSYVRVDGHGDFALPGLWDAHVHLSDASLDDDASLIAPAFVDAGVTTVRDMGGSLATIDTLKTMIARGQVIGPTVLRPGPFVDGPKDGATDRLTVETPVEAAAGVAALKREGVDFIKIHNGISKAAFFSTVQTARSSGLKVAVHLPHSVSAEEAVTAGVSTLEHTETLMESGLRSLGLPGKSVDEGARALEFEMRSGPRALISLMRSRGTCFTPTLTEYRSFAGAAPSGYSVDAPKVAPKTLMSFWDKFFPSEGSDAARKQQIRQEIFSRFGPLVRAMDAAGVPIMAGTDFGARGIYPGYSLHEELSLLSKAGLSNLHVLQAATINPARCMGVAAVSGTIEPHKRADIVVVHGNPLLSLSALGRISLVFATGRVERPRH